jgi:hypothetical protein
MEKGKGLRKFLACLPALYIMGSSAEPEMGSYVLLCFDVLYPDLLERVLLSIQRLY